MAATSANDSSSGAVNIEQTVWHIYTYATLHGNPRDPARMTSTALYKLCKECRVFDRCMVDKPLTPAQLHLIFAQVRACVRIHVCLCLLPAPLKLTN